MKRFLNTFCGLLITSLVWGSFYQTDTLENCIHLSDGSHHAYIYHNVHYARAARLQLPQMAAFEPDGDYRKLGVACPQDGWQPDLNYDEDCLLMTINSPVPLSDIQNATYPVHIHIHGGAYAAGSGENFYTQMAEYTLREQIVSITISYRLGVFGYQYMPELGSVNLGLQDQLMALQWIYQNIGHWGGDADQITLSGHSAGAQSVVYILAQPERVPIRRAIIFSAPMGCVQSISQAKQLTQKLLKALHGQDPLTCSSDSLLAASIRCREGYNPISGMIWMPTGLEQIPHNTTGIRWPEQVVVTCQADDGALFVDANRAREPIVTSSVFSHGSKAYVRFLKRQGARTLFTLRPLNLAPRGI